MLSSVISMTNIFKPKENSRLDPLTTLIKLAILPFKPEGTKLSIDNNYIFFSENTVYQFAIRTYYGDSYNDLRDITKPLHKAVAWYFDDPKMKYLFENAINGLEKLKHTYGNTGKADAVQSYIDILAGFNQRVMMEINKEKEKEKDRERDKEKRKNKPDNQTQTQNQTQNQNQNQSQNGISSINNNGNETDQQDLKIHNILKSIWTDDDKEIVMHFFQKLKNSKAKDDIEDTINSLEALLSSIHKKIEKEIKTLISL
jgi:hypothetical protein